MLSDGLTAFQMNLVVFSDSRDDESQRLTTTLCPVSQGCFELDKNFGIRLGLDGTHCRFSDWDSKTGLAVKKAIADAGLDCVYDAGYLPNVPAILGGYRKVEIVIGRNVPNQR